MFYEETLFTASVLLKFNFLLRGVPNFSVSITYYVTACIVIYLKRSVHDHILLDGKCRRKNTVPASRAAGHDHGDLCAENVLKLKVMVSFTQWLLVLLQTPGKILVFCPKGVLTYSISEQCATGERAKSKGCAVLLAWSEFWLQVLPPSPDSFVPFCHCTSHVFAESVSQWLSSLKEKCIGDRRLGQHIKNKTWWVRKWRVWRGV